jgi:hypothetical protein
MIKATTWRRKVAPDDPASEFPGVLRESDDLGARAGEQLRG